MTRQFDVLIAGGGPAGAAAALALLRRGASVAIVEHREQVEDRMGECLHGVGREILRELGVADALLQSNARATHLHRASWGGRLEERAAISSRFGPDLHLDRRRFDALLLDAAAARGAAVLLPATLRGVAVAGGGVLALIATTEGRRELRARWVLDATGSTAAVVRRLGGVRRRVDRLVGFAAHHLPARIEPATLVEAADHGWWYSSPRPDGRMVALFLTDADAGAGCITQPDERRRWLDSAPLTRERIQSSRPGELRGYLAAPGISNWDTRLPLLPVGDAMLSFDPIAADGLCFALRSGIEAAQVCRGQGTRAAMAYRKGAAALFTNHLARRESIYAAERRHRPSPFWQRHRGGMAMRPD
jgi:2-polyprenyl-6-methoxyphenol hydroxylase-like FAD-dependent oxidoreductase